MSVPHRPPWSWQPGGHATWNTCPGAPCSWLPLKVQPAWMGAPNALCPPYAAGGGPMAGGGPSGVSTQAAPQIQAPSEARAMANPLRRGGGMRAPAYQFVAPGVGITATRKSIELSPVSAPSGMRAMDWAVGGAATALRSTKALLAVPQPTESTTL